MILLLQSCNDWKVDFLRFNFLFFPVKEIFYEHTFVNFFKFTLLFQLSRISYIHNKDFIHRDIKPDNFLMGLGKRGNLVYVRTNRTIFLFVTSNISQHLRFLFSDNWFWPCEKVSWQSNENAHSIPVSSWAL